MTGLKLVVRWLSMLNEGITRLGLWISATAMGLMAILVVTQVFFRYVLNNSLSWAEDLSLMLLVCGTFLIVPYAYRRSLHVGMDLIVARFPNRLRFLVLLISGTAILFLAFYFIQVSWRFTTLSTVNANAVPIKMKYIYAILPISFVLLIPSIVELQIRSIIGCLKPIDGTAQFLIDEDKQVS